MLSKSELKKKYILEQAKILFKEKGFQSVTMTDIVAACGISRGGLYRYYKNTNEVFLDVLDSAHEPSDLNLKQAMADDQSASKILEAFFVEQKRELLEGTNTLTIAIYEFFFMHKENIQENIVQERFKQAEYIITELIQYGTDKGEFKHVTSHIVARHIILLLEGIRVSGQVMSIDQSLIDEQFHFIQTYLLRSVT